MLNFLHHFYRKLGKNCSQEVYLKTIEKEKKKDQHTVLHEYLVAIAWQLLCIVVRHLVQINLLRTKVRAIEKFLLIRSLKNFGQCCEIELAINASL